MGFIVFFSLAGTATEYLTLCCPLASLAPSSWFAALLVIFGDQSVDICKSDIQNLGRMCFSDMDPEGKHRKIFAKRCYGVGIGGCISESTLWSFADEIVQCLRGGHKNIFQPVPWEMRGGVLRIVHRSKIQLHDIIPIPL